MALPAFLPLATHRFPMSPCKLLMLFLLAFGLTLGCRTESPPPEKPVQTVAHRILGQHGHFRGHKLGTLIDSVVVKDRDFLFRRTFDELYFSIPFSPTDSTYFDVTYAFSKKRLYEIQVDIFPGDEEQLTEFHNELKQLLSERYNKEAVREGYVFWTDRFRGREIEITLRDVSTEHGRSRLSLNIIEPQIFVH